MEKWVMVARCVNKSVSQDGNDKEFPQVLTNQNKNEIIAQWQ
jgi:hypothetical protein